MGYDGYCCEHCDDSHEIRESVARIEGRLDAFFETKYVSESSFNPVRNVVYGMIGLILAGVATALVGIAIGKIGGLH